MSVLLIEVGPGGSSLSIPATIETYIESVPYLSNIWKYIDTEEIFENWILYAMVFFYFISWGAQYVRLGDYTPTMQAYTGAMAAMVIPMIANGYLFYRAVSGVIN